jgi:hypothetical protein
MRTASEIAKAHAELEGLYYLQKRATEKDSGLDFSFTCGGASGTYKTISQSLITEVTLKAYRESIDRAIFNCVKRFEEAGIPLE